MPRRAYVILCAILGTLLCLIGLVLFAQFFRFHAPGGLGVPVLAMGPNGHYFVAFAGSACVAWGGALIGAARHPEHSRTLGTATAVALVMSALYRIVAWIVGDYALLGNLLRGEAACFLLLAVAFVWLRPGRPAAGGGPRVIGRSLATLGIVALLALDFALPSTGIGRRGIGAARNDVSTAAPKLGEPMPDFALVDLDGRTLRPSDLLGQRVLLTFERSVDW